MRILDVQVDWMGLTAVMEIEMSASTIIIVDSDGNTIISQESEVETYEVDLVGLAMDKAGPDGLQMLLGYRELALKYGLGGSELWAA